jgi:hypothetical protein
MKIQPWLTDMIFTAVQPYYHYSDADQKLAEERLRTEAKEKLLVMQQRKLDQDECEESAENSTFDDSFASSGGSPPRLNSLNTQWSPGSTGSKGMNSSPRQFDEGVKDVKKGRKSIRKILFKKKWKKEKDNCK